MELGSVVVEEGEGFVRGEMVAVLAVGRVMWVSVWRWRV